MEKVLKNIINKTIANEYYNTLSNYSKLLEKEPELAKESKEISQNTYRLTEELKELVPKDKRSIVDALIGSVIAGAAIESSIAFKEGVILGVTGLSYLGEVGPEIQFI